MRKIKGSIGATKEGERSNGRFSLQAAILDVIKVYVKHRVFSYA
jgi:hypothetical protein